MHLSVESQLDGPTNLVNLKDLGLDVIHALMAWTLEPLG